MGTPLRAAQDEAGVPPGVWKGRGLAALGLTDGDVVTERQGELLLEEGRHPDADRIERELLAQGKSPTQARRATVLGRPIVHNASPKTDKAKERTPWLELDLVFRARRRHTSRGRSEVTRPGWCWSRARTSPGTRRWRDGRSRSRRSDGGAAASTAGR
ncbi:hypothetical protein GCM10017752_00240 [Streptomyces roseoviridis]